jgi:hypothetical protein
MVPGSSDRHSTRDCEKSRFEHRRGERLRARHSCNEGRRYTSGASVDRRGARGLGLGDYIYISYIKAGSRQLSMLIYHDERLSKRTSCIHKHCACLGLHGSDACGLRCRHPRRPELSEAVGCAHACSARGSNSSIYNAHKASQLAGPL